MSQTNSLQSAKLTFYVTRIAMLTAIASLLMIIELPVPIFPSFYKLDFSYFPVRDCHILYGATLRNRNSRSEKSNLISCSRRFYGQRRDWSACGYVNGIILYYSSRFDLPQKTYKKRRDYRACCFLGFGCRHILCTELLAANSRLFKSFRTGWRISGCAKSMRSHQRCKGNHCIRNASVQFGKMVDYFTFDAAHV